MTELPCPEQCVEGNLVESKSDFMDHILKHIDADYTEIEREFTAVLLRKQGVGMHWFVVFGVQTEGVMFTLEYFTKTFKGRKLCSVQCNPYNRDKTQKVWKGEDPREKKETIELVGKHFTTLHDIFECSWRVFDSKRNRDKLYQNCQEFACQLMTYAGFYDTPTGTLLRNNPDSFIGKIIASGVAIKQHSGSGWEDKTTCITN